MGEPEFFSGSGALASMDSLRDRKTVDDAIGLITSAAAIMVVVFAGFAFGNVLVVKMLGFALAVAVAIDATIVWMVIGPALLRVCGAWNWWPWGLARS